MAAASIADRFRPVGLTLLRLTTGVVFLYHGLAKVNDFHQWTQNFTHMGFPGGVAYFIGPLEVVGGILLILGLFSRVFGLLLAGEMLTALLKVHLPATKITNVPGLNPPMMLSAMAFVIFCYGGGPVSLDRLRSGRPRAKKAAAG
ncbi:MAG: DoxX family protein [Acidobacteria bacterium]|nr:MAG: DoxX family protein [Acidobacteriota bacterium]